MAADGSSSTSTWTGCSTTGQATTLDRAAVTGPMPRNLLVTGPPRSGKTTVIESVVENLEARGHRVGGLASPERRDGGERVGFDIQDVMTGEARLLAHVDRETGPRVGKYRVAVPHVDAIAGSALRRALGAADAVVVDEIAPMEVASEPFCRHVRRALDADQPTLAAVHHRSTAGFIGEVKAREDTASFEVTEATRDALPATLTARLSAWLEPAGAA